MAWKHPDSESVTKGSEFGTPSLDGGFESDMNVGFGIEDFETSEVRGRTNQRVVSCSAVAKNHHWVRVRNRLPY